VPIVIVPQPTLLLPPPAQTGPAVATHHGRPASAKPRRAGDRTRAPRAERSHSERRRIGGSPARPRTPGPDSIELHQACKRPAALGWRPLLQQTPAPRCGPGGR
jgi:hypothetical protein